MNKKAGLYQNGKLVKTWDELIQYLYVKDYDNYDDYEEYSEYNNTIEGDSIIIPDEINNINDYAFSNCIGLTSITISSSVTNIENYVFSNCPSLKNIYVNENNQNYCSVDGVLFSKDMKTLIQYPREKTGSYKIPENVTSIENYAFWNCTNLISVEIPASITNIRSFAFQHCTGLTSIEIPYGVTSIGECAFDGCTSLTNITIPDSVTSIGDWAFHNCNNLTSVTIGSGVTSIKNNAFTWCKGLKEVVWDSPVRPEMSIFKNCPNLERIIYHGKVIELNKEKNADTLDAMLKGVTSPLGKEEPVIEEPTRWQSEDERE